MKKKLRKLAIASLAALIAIGSISGCSNKTTETEKVGVGAEVKLNGDKIYPIQCDDTITYWFDGTAVWNQRYENFAETPIAKEVAKETGINVEYIHPGSGQEAEQFQILLASNELPDIVNHVWYSFPGGPDEAISQEYIYELSDIIKEYCPNYAKLLDENEDWAKGIKTDSGNYYAFPSFSDRDTIIKAVYGPVLRKDYLDKFNLELPVTIDDWENVLTTMKNGGVEIPFHGTKGGITTAFYPAFGGYTGWYQDNGVVKFGQKYCSWDRI